MNVPGDTGPVAHHDGYGIEVGSFRDRTARIVYRDGEVLRFLDAEADRHWRHLKDTGLFHRWVADGRLVGTEEIKAPAERPGDDPGFEPSRVLRHDPIPFVSYPYEWPFGMLRDAALLQLDLLLAALGEGMTVKDGTPYNVQWHGRNPVFIDIPSLVVADPGRPWDGYRQFCQLFLFPLMLQAYKGVAFQPLLRGALEGISPEDMSAFMGPRDWLRSGVVPHVKLQAWLSRRYADTTQNVGGQVKNAGFSQAMVEANARRLRKTVGRLTWPVPESAWRDYERDCHYASDDRRQKREFVETQARRWPWKTAWDLGCNTGEYSRLIAGHGERVVAMDADHAAVGGFYRRLGREGPDNILPLVMNLADPSPGLGWRESERRGLAARARPDLVLCLALVHHAVIGAHIPLGDFISWLGGLGGRLVIEYVSRDDPMVKRLLANKEDHYRDYRQEVFEAALERHFRVEDRMELASGTRMLYAAVARGIAEN